MPQVSRIVYLVGYLERDLGGGLNLLSLITSLLGYQYYSSLKIIQYSVLSDNFLIFLISIPGNKITPKFVIPILPTLSLSVPIYRS